MRHQTAVRVARLQIVGLFVIGLIFALPVAARDLDPHASIATLAPGALTARVASRPLPENPHTSTNHELVEAAALNAQQEALRLAAEKAAEVRAAAKTAAEKAAAARKAAARASATRAAARTKSTTNSRPKAASHGAPASSSSGSFHGRNRMWYPAMGISYSVSWFPCSRSRAPDNFVYRWGCAGSNNVYLMAHAWGKFAPLNRAYYSGRLARGQLLVYADGAGHIHRYRLVWWRTYPPLTSASWAWASQSRSSATLQTCVGSNSQLRLFVRFVEI